MSTLSPREKEKLEDLFDMAGGYVINTSLTNEKFGAFFKSVVGVDIHSEKYHRYGPSKAKKLRAFWDSEDDYRVGILIRALIETYFSPGDKGYEGKKELVKECNQIATRLLSGPGDFSTLKQITERFDAKYLAGQIKRMESSVQKDPELAIGMAKELIETTCKTILDKRGVPTSKNPDIQELTKLTLKALKLVPDGIRDEARGRNTIKKILQNLGTIGIGLAELRGLYGTGHGKDGNFKGLSVRHARLATGAAATLATFLFETHEERTLLQG